MVADGCTAFAPGHSFRGRLFWTLLQSSCTSYGPIVPSGLLFLAGVYIAYLAIAGRKLGA
jgi:hypothetical protein